jgi:hypothetical protein
MAVSREIKPSSKFQDCVTGDDFDILCKDNNDNQCDLETEKNLHCHQVIGRTNNVTFRTLPDFSVSKSQITFSTVPSFIHVVFS